LYFNIIINTRKTILLIDEYVYSYVKEFLRNQSIIRCGIDCGRKFSEKIVNFSHYHMQQFISERILKGFCEILYRQTVSVCMSGGGKSAKVAFGQTLLALKIYSARNELSILNFAEYFQNPFRNELLHMICEKFTIFSENFLPQSMLQRIIDWFLKNFTYEYTYLLISNMVCIYYYIKIQKLIS